MEREKTSKTYVVDQVYTEKKKYLPLLLLADPCVEMIERYLDAGDMFVMRDDEVVVGVAVVDQSGELKNLAISPEWQMQGYAKKMINHLCVHYNGRFEFMYVGTSDSGIEFYRKCGFELSHVVKNFFTDNYPEPIIDDGGIQCIDMTYLKRKL